MPPHKLIIDTDPGIDDAMAILLAACHPEVDLIGLTTIFGNVSTSTATRNALALTELAQLNIPVASGAVRPLQQAPHPHPDFVHGAGGFGDAELPEPMRAPDARSAARFLAEATAAHPGEVTICAVGPLTNLALALGETPEIAETAGQVIVMGGAVWAEGNVTPHAEANIWHDPDAAEAVFRAPWSVTLVGLDVTEQVRCSPADFAAIAEGSPKLGGFVNHAAQFYFAFHRETAGFDGCYMHDPTAVLCLTNPECFVRESHALHVSVSGVEAGRTSPVTGGAPPVEICREVEAQKVREIFVSLMTQSDACRDASAG